MRKGDKLAAMTERKYGKCPWCGKHNTFLYFATGSYHGNLWCDWICGKCLDAARELPVMKMEEKHDTKRVFKEV